MRTPVNFPYRITLKYGATTSPYSASKPHKGVDLVSNDKLIVAPEDGTVTYYANTGGASGYMMVLQGTHRHSFSHTVAGSNKVSVGTKVKAGQALAVMGATGNATGVHVHWVVNSGTVDPMSLIKEEEQMPITQGELDRLIKAMKGSEPTEAELNDTNWLNDPGLAIRTLWEFYGKNNYPPKTGNPKVTVDGTEYVPKN